MCEYLDTYLIRLIEDIADHSDVVGFEELSECATPQAAPAEGAGCKNDVFLSYSTHDKDKAREIHGALAKAGKNCFIAEKSLQPGDKFQDEIRDALEVAKEIWILVSPNSIRSAWVQREVAAAWALKKRTIPILLRCSPSDLPDFLADTHAIDYHKIGAHIQRHDLATKTIQVLATAKCYATG